VVQLTIESLCSIFVDVPFLCLITALWTFPFLQVTRRTLSAAAAEFGSAVGAHSWRSLARRLLEIEALFGLLEPLIGHPERVSNLRVFFR
jgi:hypothetical protein